MRTFPQETAQGDAGGVGPDAGSVQAAVRGQAEREAAAAAGPHHPGGAQLRPHRPDVCLPPDKGDSSVMDSQVDPEAETQAMETADTDSQGCLCWNKY